VPKSLDIYILELAFPPSRRFGCRFNLSLMSDAWAFTFSASAFNVFFWLHGSDMIRLSVQSDLLLFVFNNPLGGKKSFALAHC
jgi:hypothetical protein